VHRSGAREGLLSPGVSSPDTPPSRREGAAALAETREPRESSPHRPVRSTVNACSVPPLTTILALCRSRARPATASNEPRFLSLDQVRGSDPRVTRCPSFREHVGPLQVAHATILMSLDLVRSVFNARTLISAFYFSLSRLK